MRALLIVNPHATSTTPVRRDVIARALASELHLEVVQTRYRGHASRFAEEASRDGYNLVLTLGGDGTVNEAVNGLLRSGRPSGGGPASGSAHPASSGTHPPGSGTPASSTPASSAPASGAHPPGGGASLALPALAALPGGSANVFTRALGLPADPVDATGQVLEALVAGRHRTVGLGLAGERYFTFNAGLGFDAEVVRAVEGLRADGQPASAALYLWTATRQFYTVTDRKTPALSLERDGRPDVQRLFFGIVSNTSPWTYLGRRPVNPCPQAGFETGLDFFAVRRLSTYRTLSALSQMLSGRDRPPRGKHVVSLHDEASFTLRSSRPIAFQVDGEYVGEREAVVFRAIPHALRVIA